MNNLYPFLQQLVVKQPYYCYKKRRKEEKKFFLQKLMKTGSVLLNLAFFLAVLLLGLNSCLFRMQLQQHKESKVFGNLRLFRLRDSS